jgi:hypothetical protein
MEKPEMNKRLLRRNIAYAGAALAVLGFGSLIAPVHAGSITYITPAGSTAGGSPVDAEASFTTNNGSLTITLTDLEANPSNVGQLLSDLSFTTSGTTTLNSATLSSSLGQEITVAGGGTFTPGSSVSTGWGVSSLTGNSMTLDALGFVGPAHLIIGPPGGSGVYSNANGSIAGNGAHNPFLNETATFTITGANITVDTTITSATFSFGTTAGSNVTGQAMAVPEPGSVVMFAFGSGLVVAVSCVRSRRRAPNVGR